MEHGIWSAMLIILAVGILRVTEGIQCYQCSGSACMDPFVSTRYGVTKCQTDGACVKITTVDRNFDFITKGCRHEGGTGCELEDLSEERPWYDQLFVTETKEECYCSGDLCNEANTVHTGVYATLMPSLIVYGLTRFNANLYVCMALCILAFV